MTELNVFGQKLSEQASSKIDAMIDSESDVFSDLVNSAQLDPCVDLKGADFTCADFRGSNLIGFNFDDCILDYCNFSDSVLIGASFENASIKETRWPSIVSAAFVRHVVEQLDWRHSSHNIGIIWDSLQGADLSSRPKDFRYLVAMQRRSQIPASALFFSRSEVKKFFPKIQMHDNHSLVYGALEREMMSKTRAEMDRDTFKSERQLIFPLEGELLAEGKAKQSSTYIDKYKVLRGNIIDSKIFPEGAKRAHLGAWAWKLNLPLIPSISLYKQLIIEALST